MKQNPGGAGWALLLLTLCLLPFPSPASSQDLAAAPPAALITLAHRARLAENHPQALSLARQAKVAFDLSAPPPLPAGAASPPPNPERALLAADLRGLYLQLSAGSDRISTRRLVPQATTDAAAAPGPVPLMALPGQRLLSVTRQAPPHVWSLPTASDPLPLTPDMPGALHATLSPDGSRVALVGTDGAIHVVDTQGGAVVTSFEASPRYPQGLLMPDAHGLLLAPGRGRVQRWTLPTSPEAPPAVAWTKAQSVGLVTQMALANDGAWLLVGGETGALVILDALTGDEIFRREAHGKPLSQIAVLGADGRKALTLDEDGGAVLWQLEDNGTATPLREGRGQRVWVSADGQRLLIASGPQSLLIDADSLNGVPLVIDLPSATVLQASFSPDGRQVAVTGLGGIVDVHDTATGRPVQRLDVGTAVSALHLSAQGDDQRVLHTADAAGNLISWRLGGEGLSRAIGPLADRVHTVTVGGGPRPTALLLFAAEPPALLDLSQTEPVPLAVTDPSDPDSPLPLFIGANLAPDGETVAIVRSDRTVHLVATATGFVGPNLGGTIEEGGEERMIAFSGDGSRVAIADDRGIVRIWQTEDSALLTAVPTRYRRIRTLVLDAGGTRLLTAGSDGLVQLWDLETGQPLLALEGHRGPVLAAAFTPDGSTLATAAADGRVRLWDLQARRGLAHLDLGLSLPQAVAFTSAGLLSITTDDDRTWLYDPATQTVSARLVSAPRPWTVEISADGLRLRLARRRPAEAPAAGAVPPLDALAARLDTIHGIAASP